MTNYKYIIFDFNGTLVDSSEVMTEVLSGLIAKSRFKSLTSADFEKVRGLPFFKKIKVLLFFIRYQREFMRLVCENLSRIKFIEGVKPLLVRLNQDGTEFSVLSSNSTDMILNFFELHGVAAASVYKSQRLLGKKKTIKKFLKKNRCKPSGAVYVCDEIRDARACNKADVDIIFANWGVDKGKDLSKVKIKFVANSPQELYDFFSVRCKV